MQHPLGHETCERLAERVCLCFSVPANWTLPRMIRVRRWSAFSLKIDGLIFFVGSLERLFLDGAVVELVCSDGFSS